MTPTWTPLKVWQNSDGLISADRINKAIGSSTYWLVMHPDHIENFRNLFGDEFIENNHIIPTDVLPLDKPKKFSVERKTRQKTKR